MAKHLIHIHPRAKDRLNKQVQWYRVYRDESFVKTMLRNIVADIETLRNMPTIGCIVPTKGRHEYRMLISHKKCLIKYWYNSRSLYIVDITFTEAHSPRIF